MEYLKDDYIYHFILFSVQLSNRSLSSQCLKVTIKANVYTVRYSIKRAKKFYLVDYCQYH